MKQGIAAGLARSLMWTASDVLGSDSLFIDGGGGVEAVQGDISRGDEYPDDVGEPESNSSVVVTSEQFLKEYTADPGSYVGKKAYFQGENWRILAISHRDGFYTLNLGDKEQGA